MSINPKIKKLLEKVMNTYNDNLKKSFCHPNWITQSPLLLSKVDKETAQELLNLVKSLPNQDKKVEWEGFSEHFPFGIYVFSKTVQEEELKDFESMRNLYTGEKYLDTLSQVSQELKVITEKKEEPNNKCNKNNLCQDCQEELRKELASCKEWEVKLKKQIRENQMYTYCDGEGNRIKYSRTGGHNYQVCPNGCGKFVKETNDYGDEKELNHNCPKNKQPTEREREREREHFGVFQKKQYPIYHPL